MSVMGCGKTMATTTARLEGGNFALSED